MRQQAPILDYATETERPRRSVPWQTVGALFGTMLSPMFMCICGHLDAMSLAITGPAAILGWWGVSRSRSIPWRVVAAAVAVLASLLIFKNLLDVGWNGHEPLFG